MAMKGRSSGTDLEPDKRRFGFRGHESVGCFSSNGAVMSTSDLLPSKDNIAEALRQLTVRSNPPDQLLSAVGIFAAGILTGAALAVLFAPKPGAELRQEIGARVGGFRDKIAKTGEGVADSSKPS
jgi:hypothetical protein